MSIDGKEQRWVLNEKIRTTEKEFGWHTWLDKIGFNASGTKDIKDIFWRQNI
ncbi:MAG: hypothetical protein K2H64_01065 [Desulfovibrio sp.]|nr:hypothetical protein [Desulfovibrio sp.]